MYVLGVERTSSVRTLASYYVLHYSSTVLGVHTLKILEYYSYSSNYVIKNTRTQATTTQSTVLLPVVGLSSRSGAL
jgi:hypothetical protein